MQYTKTITRNGNLHISPYWITATVAKFGDIDGVANLAGVLGRQINIASIEDVEDDDDGDFVISRYPTSLPHKLHTFPIPLHHAFLFPPPYSLQNPYAITMFAQSLSSYSTLDTLFPPALQVSHLQYLQIYRLIAQNCWHSVSLFTTVASSGTGILIFMLVAGVMKPGMYGRGTGMIGAPAARTRRREKMMVVGFMVECWSGVCLWLCLVNVAQFGGGMLVGTSFECWEIYVAY
jgi:hypothetical protein